MEGNLWSKAVELPKQRPPISQSEKSFNLPLAPQTGRPMPPKPITGGREEGPLAGLAWNDEGLTSQVADAEHGLGPSLDGYLTRWQIHGRGDVVWQRCCRNTCTDPWQTKGTSNLRVWVSSFWASCSAGSSCLSPGTRAPTT